MSLADDSNRQNGKYFVFREAANLDELLELFRLRYRVYRNSKLAKFVPENEHGIDLDCYDVRARHFGLFSVDSGTEQLIGYLRVVEDRKVSGQADVFELVKQAPDLKGRLENKPSCPFPLMTYFPDADAFGELYRRIKDRGERLVEACRFALDKPFRSLRTAKHMVESAIAIYFFHYQFDHAVWCCDSSNKAFYRLYGFRPLDGSKDKDFARLGVSSCCVFGSAKGVPSPARERTMQMAKAYRDTGRICYFPSTPYQFCDRVTKSDLKVERVLTVH